MTLMRALAAVLRFLGVVSEWAVSFRPFVVPWYPAFAVLALCSAVAILLTEHGSSRWPALGAVVIVPLLLGEWWAYRQGRDRVGG